MMYHHPSGASACVTSAEEAWRALLVIPVHGSSIVCTINVLIVVDEVVVAPAAGASAPPVGY